MNQQPPECLPRPLLRPAREPPDLPMALLPPSPQATAHVRILLADASAASGVVHQADVRLRMGWYYLVIKLLFRLAMLHYAALVYTHSVNFGPCRRRHLLCMTLSCHSRPTTVSGLLPRHDTHW